MKILMIVAQNGFRDEEFKIPHDYFLEQHLVVDVASEKIGDCIGKYGLQITADRSFSKVDIEDYLAVVFIGGPGSKKLVGNIELQKIIKDAQSRNIIIAAICYAPVILARAGALDGKKATVFDEDGLQGPILIEEGASFIKSDLVTHGNIITSNGPAAAEKFAKEIVRLAECSDCWIRK
jgi:protease I